MIIEPDFLDHWKTQLLVQLTDDPAAPLMMVRLWGHCHTRKAWRFSDLSDHALAAICRWKGDAARLRAILIEAGFVMEEPDGQTTWLVAHDWDVVNATLVRNWANGPKGGRPKNPTITHDKPSGTPNGSDRIDREDRRDGLDRGDRDTPNPAGAGRSRKSSKRTKPIASVLPANVPDLQRGRMLQLNAIFRRPPSDAWSAGELAALEASGLLAMAELDFVDAAETLRAFYHANIPREMEKRFWKRTTLDKLLENLGGELDKARAWAREQTTGSEYRKV